MGLKAVANLGGGGGGGISGSGTPGTLAKFTGATALGDSLLSESGTTITSAATAETFGSAQTWTVGAPNSQALVVLSNAGLERTLVLDTISRAVGVGTSTTPATLLHVSDGVTAFAGTTGAGVRLDRASEALFSSSDGTRSFRAGITASTAVVGTSTAHDLLLQRNNVTAMTLAASGVGVGTTAPATTLEAYVAASTGEVRASSDVFSVVSSYAFTSVAPGFAPSIKLSRARGTRAVPVAVNALDTIGTIGWNAQGTTDHQIANIQCTAPANAGADAISSQLTFATSLTTDVLPVARMTIAPSGNVGIGTSSPSYPLHVGAGNNTGIVTTGPTAYVAANGATSLVVRDATNGIESFLYAGSSVVLAGAASNHPYQIRTNNATRITVSAAGDTSIANTLSFNSGFGSATTAYGCRAWINFNGFTPVIRGSGGVSSLTKASPGNYTINYTTAMPDVNYSAVAMKQSFVANTDCQLYDYFALRTTTSSTWVNVEAAAVVDSASINIAFFR